MQMRQGDVLIERVDALPTGLEPTPEREAGRLVVAYGESTGHAHVIVGDAQLFAEPGTDDRFVRIIAASGASLVHEEHGAIALPAGTYRVILQREYSPGEFRRVAD